MIRLGIISDERAMKSKSPQMFTHVFNELGVEGEYGRFPLEPDDVVKFVGELRSNGYNGANVTVPYKQTVIPALDEIADDAAEVGAVNTIVCCDDGKLRGYNTDVGGFINAINRAGCDLNGKSVVLGGTGGAARAIIVALKRGGAKKITLAGLFPDETAELAKLVGADTAMITEIFDGRLEADVVVNATSVSMPSEAPEMDEIVKRCELIGCEQIYDINYGRAENFWKDLAARSGARFNTGLTMLASQARLSWKYWTGREDKLELFLDGLGVKDE